MCRTLISSLVASALALGTLSEAAGNAVCRPKLAVTGVQFSKMIPPTLERKWTAIVTVDASHCAANASGYFDLGITRQKESGYETDFREQFIWLPPSVKIGVDFWADEAVEAYWVENVTPCTCLATAGR
jgi:hypothetical protein